MIHAGGKLHGIDSQFDVHVAFYLPAALTVGVFLGWLCHHVEAVIVQPVNQGADRRILVILQQRSVVEGAKQFAPAHEFLPQQLIVDVEPQRLCSRV